MAARVNKGDEILCSNKDTVNSQNSNHETICNVQPEEDSICQYEATACQPSDSPDDHVPWLAEH